MDMIERAMPVGAIEGPRMPSIGGSAKERQERRRSLFERQSGKCHWCGGAMSLEAHVPPMGPRRDYATFEHIVPKSKGGKSNFANVVLAHTICNLKRGNPAAAE